MSASTPTPDGDLVQLDERAARALRRPMTVVEDDPETWDDNEVAVYHEGRRHIVNPVVGFCDCKDAHYRDVVCQHQHRALFVLGYRAIPDWVTRSRVDPALLRRLDEGCDR